MRVLVSWLRRFVDVPVGPTELADMLLVRGFEIAGVEEVPPGVLSAPGEPVSTDRDAVIDLDLTPNRPDCLAIVNVAREVATAYSLAMRNVPAGLGVEHQLAGAGGAGLKSGATVSESHAPANGVSVTIEDPDLCPRYAAAVADVKIGPSPEWLANRLLAAGIRPINNVVDVTNYVLIELGQPMHAFDLEKLAGRELRARRARQGERIQTLDGQDRALEAGMLVIADAERPQAIAGVMGGAASEVWGGTKAIAIESAYFKPSSVRRTSKQLGLKTEASSRFERGADISAPVVGLERACELLALIGAGRCRDGYTDCYPSPRPPARIHLRRDRIRRLLGIGVADDEVVRILGGLGFLASPEADGWDVVTPTARVDLAREADLIEEVARHHGYDRLPTTFPPLVAAPPPPDTRLERDRLLRRVLAAAGFSEAITFAFIEASAAEPFAERNEEIVPIAYPLSEKFAVLRPSLLPGLVDSIAYNRRRERKDVRLFEIGATFSAGSGERRALAFGWSGAAVSEHWSGETQQVDFFDVKGVAERVAAALRVPIRFAPAVVSYLVEGRTAAILHGDTQVGLIGQLAPSIAEGRDLPAGEELYVGELDLDSLPRQVPTDVRAEPLPRYPSIVRDVSIVVSEALPAEAVRGTIVAAAPPTLAGVREFDRYKGKGIPEGQVSISLHLTFRAAERTLTDAEVQEAMDAIVDALRREHHAVRR